MYPRQYHGNAMNSGNVPFHDNYQSSNNVQVFTHPLSTQPYHEQVTYPIVNANLHNTQATPVYTTHPFHDRYINPLQQFEYQDTNLYDHSDQGIFTIPHQPVLQINNRTGQTNGWYDPNSCGIPQFQRNRNILPDPPVTTVPHDFFGGPSRPTSGINFIVHQSSPTTTSPIFPPDTLMISPSEQINSMSYSESIPDQMHFDNDCFHDSITLENETTSQTLEHFENFQVDYGHNDIDGSNVAQCDKSISLSPQTYLDKNVFGLRPVTIHEPFTNSDNHSSSFHYSEKQENGLPPFRMNHNVPQNNYHHEFHQYEEQKQGIPQFQKDRPPKNHIKVHPNGTQEKGIPQFQRGNNLNSTAKANKEIIYNGNDLSTGNKLLFTHSTNDNIQTKRFVNPYIKRFSTSENIPDSIEMENSDDVQKQDIIDTNDPFDQFQMDDNIEEPINTNMEIPNINDDLSRGNQPLISRATSYDIKAKYVNPYTKRLLPSKSKATNIEMEMEHCDDDIRLLDIDNMKNSPYKLQPRNTLRDTIRFFNNGIEVDINNQPLQRPHSLSNSVDMKPLDKKQYNAKKEGIAENQWDDLNDDDFDLMGKTSLWDTMK
jgi:hypothetical protein